MLGKLVPFGYATPDAQARLEALMQNKKTMLVNIRFNPVSRWNPVWRKKTLQLTWQERYYALPCLGNINYKGGPILIANPDLGIPVLVRILQRGCNLILLCACAKYETCHRKVVCELVRQVLPEVEVIL